MTDLESPNNKSYAIKIEYLRKEGASGHLPHEDMVVSEIPKNGYTRHFAEMVDRGPLPMGTLEQCQPKAGQYLVITLLGPSLVDVADLCPKMAFSPPTMANLAKQAFEALESMHESGFLHRDIKPANFVVGLGPQKHELIIVDFGFARRFLDAKGNRLHPRAKAPFRGTSPYASAHSFAHREQAPDDDLWSLFYMLYDLRTGALPWSKASRSATVQDIKKRILPKDWLNAVEEEYVTFHEYLTSLHFDMKIDYPYLHGHFERV